MVGRKNCWWLAQQAGHADPGRMQRLLGRARWDADALRDALLHLVAAVLAVSDGVLVVDETGFAKKGTASVGVARQYSGTLGKVDNCQVAVFLAYATSRARLLIDRVLYLPKTWAGDPERREQAGVPSEVVFTTKAQLALVMIRRVVAAGLAAAWVAADEAYGRDRRFRAGLRSSGWAMWSRFHATSTSPSSVNATASTSWSLTLPPVRDRPTPAAWARKALASTGGRGSASTATPGSTASWCAAPATARLPTTWPGMPPRPPSLPWSR